MDIKVIDKSTTDKIHVHYKPVKNWHKAGPFCVDGRHGPVTAGQTHPDNLHVQALGGSLLFAVLLYLLDQNDQDFDQAWVEAQTRLNKAGYSLGVHRGSHRTDIASDCGFADNLPKIIARLAENESEIRSIIESATQPLDEQTAQTWKELVSRADNRKNIEGFVNGEQLIKAAETAGGSVQTLDGDHGEVAAAVNLADGTTLDTAKLVVNGLQAFNLDLWYVLHVAEELLELEKERAMLATLGLYVATEMVLVEDKKNYRLPVIIHS